MCVSEHACIYFVCVYFVSVGVHVSMRIRLHVCIRCECVCVHTVFFNMSPPPLCVCVCVCCFSQYLQCCVGLCISHQFTGSRRINRRKICAVCQATRVCNIHAL